MSANCPHCGQQLPAAAPEPQGTDPFPPGYVEPRTGRVAVRVKAYADSILNGDVSAYWFDREEDACGLDPWRVVDGVDLPSDPARTSMDVWFANGRCVKVGPHMTFFMAEEHARKLGVTPDPFLLAPPYRG